MLPNDIKNDEKKSGELLSFYYMYLYMYKHFIYTRIKHCFYVKIIILCT